MNRKHKRRVKRGDGAPHDETVSQEWTDHEHVSDAARIEAQKLIEEAGSAELAKKAIEAVERQPRKTAKEK